MATQPENKDKTETKIADDELSDKDLAKVTGGGTNTRETSHPTISEITVTKVVDGSTP
jgi:bacteriocin-like protein